MTTEFTIRRSTVEIISASPPTPDMVLVRCSFCGAWHHNGIEVQLPQCGPCHDDFISGGS